MNSQESLTFLIDSIEGAIGPIRSRRMFDGVGLWKDGTFFGMVSANALSIRLDEASEAEYLACGFIPNDPSSAGKGRRRYYEVPADVIEDRAELERWLERSIDAALATDA